MATEVRHIERIGDTQANIQAGLDSLQIAILTDQNEELVWYDSGANQLYYGVANKYWNGSTYTYMSVEFDDVTAKGDMFATGGYYGATDTDTGMLVSGSDTLSLLTGGSPAMIVYASGNIDMYGDLAVDGNVTLGDSAADSHTLQGSLTFDNFVLDNDGGRNTFLRGNEADNSWYLNILAPYNGGAVNQKTGISLYNYNNTSSTDTIATDYERLELTYSSSDGWWEMRTTSGGTGTTPEIRIASAQDITIDSASTLHLRGSAGITLDNATTINGTLTIDPGTQAYEVGNRDNGALYIQPQTNFSALELYTNSGTGTQNASFQLFGVGTPSATTDRERLLLLANSNGTTIDQFEIYTEANGTGTLRPLVLYTEGNTDQLKINTDGSVTTSGNVTLGNASGDAHTVNGTLTINASGTQDYEFGTRFASFYLSGTSAGTGGALDIFSNDGDNTDGVDLSLYSLGTSLDVTNSERLHLRWRTGDNEYQIFTDASGTGTIRPLVLYTGSNTDQLHLATDGNVGIGTDSPSTELDVTGSVSLTKFLSIAPQRVTLTADDTLVTLTSSILLISSDVTRTSPSLRTFGITAGTYDGQVLLLVMQVGVVGQGGAELDDSVAGSATVGPVPPYDDSFVLVWDDTNSEWRHIFHT